MRGWRNHGGFFEDFAKHREISARICLDATLLPRETGASAGGREMSGNGRDLGRRGLLALAVCGLLAGLGAYGAGQEGLARGLWAAGVVPVLAGLVVEIVASLRRGEVGLDVVAALSMSAALIFGEPLAAAVVAVMYAGGAFLESYAEGRARGAMRALLERVPRQAGRLRGGVLEEIALDQIAPGDRLLVRQGEVVAVDGRLDSDLGFLDTSALTGEAMPVRLGRGADLLSGATNAGDAFEMIAARPAAESTYAGIVRLVEAAQASKAPMARLADRWSMGFLAVTLVLAGAAWAASGDPVRAVAVLVIATPCPLILAVPVALVAGLSRAAHYGVLIKGAGPLEAMARGRVLVLDKTGTLTDGRPQIVAIVPAAGVAEAEVLRVAAGLDQGSKHPVAQAIVAAAQARGMVLALPEGLAEAPGEGVSARFEGGAAAVGGGAFVARALGLGAVPAPPGAAPGAVLVAVGGAGRFLGWLVMADPLRAGAADFVAGLRRAGVGRVVLATGDRAEVAEEVTRGLGFDALRAGLSPDQKVLTVLSERKFGPVMMVGDGVNDAPALAAADVGVAMGARGAAASAEAADVVLLVDRVDRLLPGLEIARRARAIALQSAGVGIGLSVIGMGVAAAGGLAPVEGAILQEVIDVAVILNALRALRIVPPSGDPGGD